MERKTHDVRPDADLKRMLDVYREMNGCTHIDTARRIREALGIEDKEQEEFRAFVLETLVNEVFFPEGLKNRFDLGDRELFRDFEYDPDGKVEDMFLFSQLFLRLDTGLFPKELQTSEIKQRFAGQGDAWKSVLRDKVQGTQCGIDVFCQNDPNFEALCRLVVPDFKSTDSTSREKTIS